MDDVELGNMERGGRNKEEEGGRRNKKEEGNEERRKWRSKEEAGEREREREAGGGMRWGGVGEWGVRWTSGQQWNIDYFISFYFTFIFCLPSLSLTPLLLPAPPAQRVCVCVLAHLSVRFFEQRMKKRIPKQHLTSIDNYETINHHNPKQGGWPTLKSPLKSPLESTGPSITFKTDRTSARNGSSGGVNEQSA